MKKNSLINELHLMFVDHNVNIKNKYGKKPKDKNTPEYIKFQEAKALCAGNLSANDKVYKFIISVLSIGLLLNLTLLIEMCFQEDYAAKMFFVASSMFAIMVFLLSVIGFSYITDRKYLMSRYHDLYFKEIEVSEKIKYQIRKEFDDDIKNIEELKYFLIKKGVKR